MAGPDKAVHNWEREVDQSEGPIHAPARLTKQDTVASEVGPEWVLSSVGLRTSSVPAAGSELVAAACSAWPKVLAHARKELSRHGMEPEATSLATELWEGVLLSVSKTLERLNGKRGEIADLEAYLVGAFHHRFRRALKKEQRRQATIQLVSSVSELEALGIGNRTAWEHDLDGLLHAKQILQRMDEWSRRVWIAREHGYSWEDIGRSLGTSGHRVGLRFRRRMEILRARLSRHA